MEFASHCLRIAIGQSDQCELTQCDGDDGVVVVHAGCRLLSLATAVYLDTNVPCVCAPRMELSARPAAGNTGDVGASEQGRRRRALRPLRESAASCLVDDPHDSGRRGWRPGAHGHVPRGLRQGKTLVGFGRRGLL